MGAQCLKNNSNISEQTDPNNITMGIYQYWTVYFDSNPFEIPHIIVSLNSQALVLQIGASWNGNLKYRTRGAGATEWTVWYSIATN